MERWRWLWAVGMAACVACSKGEDSSKQPITGAAGTQPLPASGGNPQAGIGAGAGPMGTGGPMTMVPGGMPSAGSSVPVAPASGGSGGDGTTPGDPGGKPTNPGSTPAVHGWTMMGGDARNNYWNHDETTISVANAAQLQELWVFEVAGYPPGSPVVADGKVFVLATGGAYAIDLETGKQLWANLDIKGQSSMAYDGEFLYAHTTPGATLYKLKASDGSVVWGPIKTYDMGGADGTSSPVLADGKVLVGHATVNEIIPASPDDQTNSRGGVFAADAETGAMAWHYFTVELPENGAMVWSTVSVDLQAGVVFAATGNNYTVAGEHSDAIHAIDLESGMKLWSNQVRQKDTWTLGGTGATGEDTDFGANPILADVGDMKLVGDGDKGSAFWVLDRETGKTLWSRTDLSTSHNAANGGVLNNGAFDGEAFYVIANQPNSASLLHKLNATDGHDVWPAKMFPTVTWGAPAGANGVLFVPVNSDLVVLDAATGDELKRFDTGGTIVAGSPAIVDGKVVVKSGMQYPLDFTGSVKNNNQIHCYGLK